MLNFKPQQHTEVSRCWVTLGECKVWDLHYPCFLYPTVMRWTGLMHHVMPHAMTAAADGDYHGCMSRCFAMLSLLHILAIYILASTSNSQG